MRGWQFVSSSATTTMESPNGKTWAKIDENVDQEKKWIIFPLAGGCSEGLYAFRFSLKYAAGILYYMEKSLPCFTVRR